MIQVVNRAIDIIEYVANEAERPKLLGEIADEFKLNTSTCANIVKTLVVRGYLQKSNGKGYVPGAQLLNIAEGSGNHRNLIEMSQNEMEAIAKKLNENTLLAVMRQDRRVVIHKVEANQLVQAQTPVEKQVWDSATGRLFVAMLDNKVLEKFINQYGLPPGVMWKEASTKRKLLEQTDIIRKQGYAITEDITEITGVAAPILKKGKVVAGFSIYMPSFRYNSIFRKKIIEACIVSAKKISAKFV